MTRKSKQADAATGTGAERPRLNLRIVFDFRSRKFGYYDVDAETHCDPSNSRPRTRRPTQHFNLPTRSPPMMVASMPSIWSSKAAIGFADQA